MRIFTILVVAMMALVISPHAYSPEVLAMDTSLSDCTSLSIPSSPHAPPPQNDFPDFNTPRPHIAAASSYPAALHIWDVTIALNDLVVMTNEALDFSMATIRSGKEREIVILVFTAIDLAHGPRADMEAFIAPLTAALKR